MSDTCSRVGCNQPLNSDGLCLVHDRDHLINEILKQQVKANVIHTPELGDCLGEAKECITGERQDSYGNPEDSFALIAEYWESYLINKFELWATKSGVDIDSFFTDGILTATDVAHMMMLLKLARCSGQKSKRDNYVDIAGYASITADKLINQR